jgi:hypothetical protein
MVNRGHLIAHNGLQISALGLCRPDFGAKLLHFNETLSKLPKSWCRRGLFRCLSFLRRLAGVNFLTHPNIPRGLTMAHPEQLACHND